MDEIKSVCHITLRSRISSQERFHPPRADLTACSPLRITRICRVFLLPVLISVCVFWFNNAGCCKHLLLRNKCNKLAKSIKFLRKFAKNFSLFVALVLQNAFRCGKIVVQDIYLAKISVNCNQNNQRGTHMTISYNKLWKLLVDKKMSKADLRRATDMAPNTMTSLRRDKKVSMDVILRICQVLNCDIGDIMSVCHGETAN